MGAGFTILHAGKDGVRKTDTSFDPKKRSDPRDIRRRLRRIFVSEERLIREICGYGIWEKFTIPWKPETLPEDVAVAGVYYRPERRGFDFVISSLAFALVKEGGDIPYLADELAMVRICLSRRDLEKLNKLPKREKAKAIEGTEKKM